MKEKRVLKPVKTAGESFEIRLDEDIFHISVEGKKVKSMPGKAANPSLVLITTREYFLELVTYHLNPIQAVEGGKCQLEGDLNKLNECLYYLNQDH